MDEHAHPTESLIFTVRGIADHLEEERAAGAAFAFSDLWPDHPAKLFADSLRDGN